MYSIYNDINFINGSKVILQLYCPNKKEKSCTTNAWHKVDEDKFSCNDCGTIETMKEGYYTKEVRI